MEEWCGHCGDFVAEDEFDELDGLVWTAEGDRHPAEEPRVEEADAG